MSTREQLDELGREVMSRVRDGSIDATRVRLGRKLHRTGEDWLDELQLLSPEQMALVNRLIRVHTDQVIAHFLGLFEDDRRFRLMVSNDDGSDIDAVKMADDLPSILHGKHGWISRFSKNEGEGQ